MNGFLTLAAEAPLTGDDFPAGILIIAIGAAIVCAVITTILAKRKKDDEDDDSEE